jgi:hypothetical protein
MTPELLRNITALPGDRRGVRGEAQFRQASAYHLSVNQVSYSVVTDLLETIGLHVRCTARRALAHSLETMPKNFNSRVTGSGKCGRARSRSMRHAGGGGLTARRGSAQVVQLTAGS